MITLETGHSKDYKFYPYNPVKDYWCVNFGFKDIEDENGPNTQCYHLFSNHYPTLDEVVKEMSDVINTEVEEAIVNFTYNDELVWLSRENLSNYLLAAYSGANKITIKIGDELTPRYISVDTEPFISAINTHIQDCLREGWARKDQYREELSQILQ